MSEDVNPEPGKPIRGEEPHDRLTRLCAAMCDTLDAHPERGAEKVIVFMQDGNRGGLQTHGYDDDTEPLVDLFMHLRAMFEAQGKELQIHALPGQG